VERTGSYIYLMTQSLTFNLLLHRIIIESIHFEALGLQIIHSSHDPVPLNEPAAARNNHGKAMTQWMSFLSSE
jgi:hypothetical protein